MNEFDLIRRYFERQPPLLRPGEQGSLLPVTQTSHLEGQSLLQLGIGDDCALLGGPLEGAHLAVSSDMLVAGRHFFHDTDAAAIGHKALAVNLSDLAAMGAWPVGFTLALALPETDPHWLEGFSQGLLTLASRAACPLIGGDTTRGPLTLSITVLGQVPHSRALRRDGAQAGDDIWVSGELGAAALAVQLRRTQPAQTVPIEALQRLNWPLPRFDVGLALRGVASAAMDISDGLAGDLAHLLAASGRRQGHALGAVLDSHSLPLAACLRELPPDEALTLALHGGDDYELLFTASPELAATVAQRCPTAHRIGQVTSVSGMLLSDAKRRTRPLEPRGYDHFST